MMAKTFRLLTMMGLLTAVFWTMNCGNQPETIVSKPTESQSAAVAPANTEAVVSTPTPEPLALAPAGIEAEKSVASGLDNIALEDLKRFIQRRASKPLFLLVWTSGSSPCLELAALIAELHQKYRDERIDFLALSIDAVSETVGNVPTAIREHKITLPVKILTEKDADKIVASLDLSWNGEVPMVFLYDGQGKIAEKYSAPQPKETYDKAIQSLLKKK
ncbi:MAG: TlpA disulfide reductase family protein [Candidatus Omnitrophota bacterium]